ncbi:hypothetical protein TNCT_332671 [Trichonephila clavata]|uniref:Uncharacterized protein n=1 Tax=Trichonephila clavata TaxID=2740835 RepID=A0A8X6HW36_TRICU|nr:hypothetical protein TNCT_332671 [Trichonephila clavata]
MSPTSLPPGSNKRTREKLRDLTELSYRVKGGNGASESSPLDGRADAIGVINVSDAHFIILMQKMSAFRVTHSGAGGIPNDESVGYLVREYNRRGPLIINLFAATPPCHVRKN